MISGGKEEDVLSLLAGKKSRALLTLSWFTERTALMPMAFLDTQRLQLKRVVFLPVPGFVREEENHVKLGTIWNLSRLELYKGFIIRQSFRGKDFIYFDPVEAEDYVTLNDINEVLEKGEKEKPSVSLVREDIGTLGDSVLTLIRIAKYQLLKYLPTILIVDKKPRGFTSTLALVYYAVDREVFDELKADVIVAREYQYPMLAVELDEVGYEFIRATKLRTLMLLQQQLELFIQRLVMEQEAGGEGGVLV